MGMYDIVKINPEILFVSKAVRLQIKKENVEWQTKDLENCLSNYEISDSGRLIETIKDDMADLAFHGIFGFHSNVGKRWYSFLAKFTDGNLVGIVRVKDIIKYAWPPTPLNSVCP